MLSDYVTCRWSHAGRLKWAHWFLIRMPLNTRRDGEIHRWGPVPPQGPAMIIFSIFSLHRAPEAAEGPPEQTVSWLLRAMLVRCVSYTKRTHSDVMHGSTVSWMLFTAMTTLSGHVDPKVHSWSDDHLWTTGVVAALTFIEILFCGMSRHLIYKLLHLYTKCIVN